MEPEFPGNWLTLLFCVTGIFIAFQLARAEWRRHQAPRLGEKIFATTPRLLRRLAGSLLLGLLMALLLLGTSALDFGGDPLPFLLYWGVFAVLLIVLFAIGAADWLDTKRLLHLQRGEILKQMARQAPGGEAAEGRPRAPPSEGS